MSRRFRICLAKGGRGCLRPSYRRPKLTLISKKSKKYRYGRNFQNITSNERWIIGFSYVMSHFGTDILKIMALFLFWHLIILLTDRIWSPSPDFRRPKHSQNCPAANFRPKGVCSLMYTRLFTFYGPTNISLCFRLTGQRVKNLLFSLISFAAPQKTLAAYCELNFDATKLT